MTDRNRLVEERDAAKANWFEFLDQCWFGTPEQREANRDNPDRYKQLKAAFEAAQQKLDEWRPA
jgi:hypothetical protein